MIGGYPVPVFANKHALGDANDAVGYTDPETHEIGVQQPGQSGAAEADRMLHEHIHAISFIMIPAGAGLTEAQVNIVSTGLIDALARNAPLREYLWHRLLSQGPSPEPSSASSGSPSPSPTASRAD